MRALRAYLRHPQAVALLVDERGWAQVTAAPGDRDGHERDCWVAKEKAHEIYMTDDPVRATAPAR